MHDIFDEAIGASPPSRIDIDAVIVRRRRMVQLRAAGGVGGVVAAIAAVAVVVGVSGGGAATQPPGNAGHSSAATSTGASAASLPTRPPESPQQTMQRLTVTVTSRLTALLPGVQLSDWRSQAPGVRVYPRDAEPDSYLSVLRVTTDAGSGVFTLVSAPRTTASPSASPTGPLTERPKPPTTCADFWAGSQTAPAHPDDRQCTAGTGPDGQLVLSAVEKLTADAIRYGVVVLWADAYVEVTLDNYFKGWEGDGDPPTMTFMPSPQLTLEQLGSLACDPELAS
ncbi:hypothetical protein ACFFX1_26180 [Dactylosporangium sucinum]|uniref:Uncharacterized protein n=1 Tax=Dactylosporangium sucinum TaxID=1424081 RepID=A0A917WL40_9ACTN|nr:hypothetical protein [Dactylosporangium sucinum]GGM12163.1 hypothetical protein GCM10007977_011660 [Dactylosporangium sucinum]